MYITLTLPMNSNFSTGLSYRFITCENCPTISIATQILAGKKAETRADTDAAGLAAADGRAKRLGTVLDQQ